MKSEPYSLGESILILTTCATIDKQYFDALRRYQITDTTLTKLLLIAGVTHPVFVEEVLRKDSIDRPAQDRTRIAEHVARTSCWHGHDPFYRHHDPHRTRTSKDSAQDNLT